MIVPAAFRNNNNWIPRYSPPVTKFVKPGCYTSIDSLLKAVVKAAVGKKVGEADSDKLLLWKIDPVTRKLSVKFNGSIEEEGLIILPKSSDLKNILGTSVIIDCQQDTSRGAVGVESKSTNTVKQVGQWPVDLNAGSHTMFLYCDLVQNETLGDTQTALLRSIPLNSIAHSIGSVNHKSFTNLQWKPIVKSHLQSITLSLANELGQKKPFLSGRRTNIDIALPLAPQQ